MSDVEDSHRSYSIRLSEAPLGLVRALPAIGTQQHTSRFSTQHSQPALKNSELFTETRVPTLQATKPRKATVGQFLPLAFRA